ncbi:MAG: putative 2OG-Fe(II) oxygenase [Pelagibacterales bacterium]|nr:putative 2OG-Fe(II) oxygenase [Pelagibacterales bacterium]
MEQFLNFFSLTIYKSKISLDENERNNLIDEILNQKKKTNDENNKPEKRAWTGDTQGYEYLYLNPKFQNLFKDIEKHVLNYIKKFNFDTNKINIYFQRAWATVSNKNESISSHDHPQSHISFAYYLKKNKQDGGISFIDNHKHSEFIKNSFGSKTLINQKIIKESTFFNSNSVNLLAEQDDIIIFPSKTLHGTQINNTNESRISISADITIISKDSEKIEQLITPIDKWKKFNI